MFQDFERSDQGHARPGLRRESLFQQSFTEKKKLLLERSSRKRSRRAKKAPDTKHVRDIDLG